MINGINEILSYLNNSHYTVGKLTDMELITIQFYGNEIMIMTKYYN